MSSIHYKRFPCCFIINLPDVLQHLKKLTTILLLFLTGSAGAQDITGGWHGSLDISGIQLRLVLHISASDDGLTATLDSPDQGTTGIPVGSVTFRDDSLQVDVPVIGARYEGLREADTVINGLFYQGGQQLPLRLVKKDTQSIAIERPQEPKPPFPYDIEEVRFTNDEAGIMLAGTLTGQKQMGRFRP